MKKTISGVLLTLTAAFSLFACGKKKTEGTTAAKTTKIKSKKPIEKKNKIVFYCWNNEFQSRVNDYYSEVNAFDANFTYLMDGNYIEWIPTPNEGGAYQDALDKGLNAGNVDMFVFEADYATKYVKLDKTANLAGIEGLDMSKQYKYTKDIVTLGTQIKGTSWQATPGITMYNLKVAKAIWGNNVTTADMETKLSTEANFKEAAAQVKTNGTTVAGKISKFMMIGPDCWFRMYSNNLHAKMYTEEGTTKSLKIDRSLLQWAKDTNDFYTSRYIKSVDDDYGLWGSAWGAEQGKDNCLCIFSCPWYTDFCLTGNRYNEGEKDTAVGKRTDCNIRLAKSHKGWFWGGTWLTATTDGLGKAAIKDSIVSLIKTMTTDKTTLVNIAKGAGDFTNNSDAMDELAASNFKYDYFGGQNPFAYYVASIEGADLSKASDFDQQVAEGIQSAFRQFFQKNITAQAAWEELKEELATKTKIAATSITLDGTIVGNVITPATGE